MASRSLCRGMSYSVVCFTEDCNDALFSEYFFLMDANSLQNCASFVTRQKQFRTVSFCNWQWKRGQFFVFFGGQTVLGSAKLCTYLSHGPN